MSSNFGKKNVFRLSCSATEILKVHESNDQSKESKEDSLAFNFILSYRLKMDFGSLTFDRYTALLQ